MLKVFIMKGRQRSTMLVLLFFFAMVAFAVPAKPGFTRTLTITDGSTVNAMLVGDEYLHYWLGDDGKAYQAVSQQKRGSKGGSEDGDAVYQAFDVEAAKKSADERRSNANQQRARRLAPRKVGSVGNISGEKKGIIILVNFKDKAFTATQSDFYNLANTVNYNSGNFKGSMYDYFYAQSDGQFRLTFDVVGPYTVSKNYAYYGANDSNGSDVHPAEMVIEAVKLADNDVNFANYDWDNDGYVDQVYVVYAGKGEADGGAEDTIWPHEYDLYSANYYGDGECIQILDDVKIKTYACGGEQNGSTGETAGIGTMCHEFSHCLGYPDFYDTDYSGGQGMGYWDLMNSGSYNGNGYRPAGYTSYERWVAGWKTPIELEYTQTISNMAALQTTGSNSYIIYNKGNNNEYYLLENRQKTGWDTSLPGAGLLILHVDYDADVWSHNKPNDDPAHQRMTWIAADNEYQYNLTSNGKKSYTRAGMANDPFPYGSVNSFGKNTTPAATLYNANTDGTYYLDSSVENITQNSDGTISFNFKGIGNVYMPNLSPEGGRFAKDQTVTVTIAAETGATIYYTTNGDTPTTTSTLYTAPFTVNTTTTVKAIAVKDGEQSGVATTTYTFVDPLILADENLSLSADAGSSETKPLIVLTEGLTQDITLTLSDANNVFSLSTTTISKSQEEATVDVTFSPTIAGTYSGTITLTSTGAAPVTVSLSATATLPVPTTPTGLTLSEETATSFTASWSAVTLAESYELDVATVTESSSTGATLTENFTGFTAVSSYSSTSDYQTVASGTWSYENVIISPNGTANGDGSTGFAQMKAGAGILYLPTIDYPTSITVTAYASSGSLTLQQKVDDSWNDIKSWDLSSTCTTYSYTFTNTGAATQLRFVAGSKATYIHDVTVNYSSSTITYNSISGYPKSVGSVTSYAVTGLTSGTQYAVRVRAVNTYGNSDWSDVASITTDAAPTAPELTASLGTSINAYVGDEDIEFTVTATGYPEPTITATCTEGAYFIFENGELIFEPDTEGTYHFVFTATNDAGTDQLTVTITVSPAPITVPTLSITDVTTTTASATWTACDGVSSYTLQLASDDQFTTGGSGGSSATQILSENFSGFTGTGTADISNSLNNYTATTGWNGSKVYPENEMAKIGASSSQGWIMTPALNASGTLTVVWSAYRYGTSDKNTILLGISENGTDFDEETITIGDEIDTFTNTFTVSGSTVYVRWMASGSSKARFYLDDITISTGGSGSGSGSGSLIAEYTVTEGTSYTFTGLSPRTTYYARVKGDAGWSNVEEFKTIDPAIAYYQNADGKTGSELKTAMCGIIYNRTEKSYDDLWTAYQSTDVRSDGKIWDMYSNITNYDPVNGSHANSEEGSGFNREHSFPKSWFGGEVMPMYTDLHHLYPVDGNINTRRSNNPYGETNGEDYKSANDFSKLGACTYPGYTGKVFEPNDEYKGDFARTYFYMVTCYEEKLHDWYTNFSSTEVTAVIDGSTYPALQTWQLNMLMKWAKNDPVSEKERNRNNAVYAIQHNRNPFIDFPYMAEYIWGERAGQLLDMSHLISSTDPRFVVGESNGWIDNPSAIDGVAADGSSAPSQPARITKVIIDGKLYILVGKARYTPTGQKVD